MNRRNFLKAAGVSISLPFMPSLYSSKKAEKLIGIKRLVCIHQCLGYESRNFFPKQFGENYKASPTLSPLMANKDKFTVFSGLEHGVGGGHYAEHAFLTGVHIDDAKNFKEGNISVDIKAAEHVGFQTRLPSINLALPGGVGRYDRTSWNRTGGSIPMNSKLSFMFNKLFMDDSKEAKRKASEILHENHSIIDTVLDQSKGLSKNLDKIDKSKLDEFFTSLRETEKNIQVQQRWVLKDKPKVDPLTTLPTNIKELFPLYYKLMTLALQTDSTRVATLQLPVTNNVYNDLEGVHEGYHLLSHHGQDKGRLTQLRTVEKFHMTIFNQFIEQLSDIKEVNGSLLDNTLVMHGAGMGNGSAHSNKNLPVILAGGGLKHGSHRNMYKSGKSPEKLCNLYLAMLHWFGVETSNFGTSTGTVSL
ncbi:MAG: DUF1552 domain-containing protein [Lentisphaeraceae bacterium]|nr:DUF1552 domain-containing protein [Lentisphaeraceae bacterium]